MAIEKVKAYFAQFGMEERVMEAATSSATVEAVRLQGPHAEV